MGFKVLLMMDLREQLSRGCRNVVRVLGLGFRPGSDGHDATPESMFICQELCTGGSLRSMVIKQMCKPHQVCDGPGPIPELLGNVGLVRI